MAIRNCIANCWDLSRKMTGSHSQGFRMKIIFLMSLEWFVHSKKSFYPNSCVHIYLNYMAKILWSRTSKAFIHMKICVRFFFVGFYPYRWTKCVTPSKIQDKKNKEGEREMERKGLENVFTAEMYCVIFGLR